VESQTRGVVPIRSFGHTKRAAEEAIDVTN
jgi:hypothetical protein